ncbi:MAG: hypothetical protein ACREB5_07095, partial [Sphingomonadaceae bacterium]
MKRALENSHRLFAAANLAFPIARCFGDKFEQMTVRVLEINPTPAEAVVDFPGPCPGRIGPIG